MDERNSMSEKKKGVAAAVISAFFFGLIPLFVRCAQAGGSNAFSTVFYRFFLSLPALYIYLWKKKIPLKISKEDLKHVVIITVFGYGGTALLLFNSYSYIPSGMATTLHFGYPVFVILGSIIFLREKVKPVKLLCVGLCVGGIVLFYNGGGGTNLLGMSLAFISGMTYAFYIIYLDRSPLAAMNPFKLIFYMHSVACPLFLFFIAVSGNFVIPSEPATWGWLLLLSIGAAFIGVFFFQKGVHLIGPQNAAILSTFEPITSLLVGALVYHETFPARGMIGCALILISAVIVASGKE